MRSAISGGTRYPVAHARSHGFGVPLFTIARLSRSLSESANPQVDEHHFQEDWARVNNDPTNADSGVFRLSAVKERRKSKRFQMQLPVALQTEDGPVGACTRDVSSRGLFLAMDRELRAGSNIRFSMTLPPEITLTGPTPVTGEGVVLRTEHAPSAEGLWNTIVVVAQYKFIRSSPPR